MASNPPRPRGPLAVGRTVAFAAGIGAFVLAMQSGLGVIHATLPSAHMAQHMILSMVRPVAIALVRAGHARPPHPAGAAAALAAGGPALRVAKVLTFPPLTLLLYIVSPWALYFSGWYDASLQSSFVHEAMHVHLVVVGCLFFWPLVGVDPVPGRVATRSGGCSCC